MQKNHQARIFFSFGVLALICAGVLVGFFSQLFGDIFPNHGEYEDLHNQNTENTTNTNVNSDYDPYVTVIPKEIIGGRPQPLATDPTKGATNPTVTIVEFGDFQCDSCAKMKPILDQILEEYPDDVMLVWKDYPIPSAHPQAQQAAIAARCAQDQNAFWEYHDALLDQQDTFATEPWSDIASSLGLDTTKFETCMQNSEEKEKIITDGYFIGRSLEIDSTPAYYVNGQLLTGARSVDELRSAIDQEIDSANSSNEK